MPLPGQYAARSGKRRGNKHRKMNGAHRESHHPACPLLLPRRRPQLLHTAHLLQIACFPKPRLFIFTLFSRCLFSLLRSGLPFFSALYFFRALLPAARFPRGNPAYVFPIEAKSPSAPCFAPAVLLPFSSIPACPLSYPVRFPFASPRSLFRLSLQSRPPVVTSLFPFSFPPRASAFRLNAILSVVTFPLHVTFPCSRFRLSPQSRPPVATSLFPLAFPACAFSFSPILSLTPEKGSKKSPSLTEKASGLRLFPIRPIKKPSQREL